MNPLHLFPELPLLKKELSEQASRKRTYNVRVAYAGALCLFFIYQIFSLISGGSYNITSVMGQGDRIFNNLIFIQFIGIYLLLPTMMAGVLTLEKERGSLPLLFLTDLKASDILWQKYLSRLLPMLTFLMLSMPLLAISYSYGGMSITYLRWSIFLQIMACFQIGALCLMFSSYCRTTMSSLICCYLSYAIYFSFFGGALFLLDKKGTTFQLLDKSGFLNLCAPYLLLETGGRDPARLWLGVSASMVLFTAVCLILARIWIYRRSNLPEKNLIFEFFSKLDRALESLNTKLGNSLIRIIPGSNPDDEHPITWRELRRKGLGKPIYLLIQIIIIEIPLVFVCIQAMEKPQAASEALNYSVLLTVLWGLGVLIISMISVSSITSERNKQTLDVIMTTPITGMDMVTKKMRAIKRTILLLYIPFVTIFFFEAAVEMNMPGRPPETLTDPNMYILMSVVSVAVIMNLFAWVSFWCGLRIRNRMIAVVTAFSVLVLWTAAPLILSRFEGFYASMLSPASVVVLLELPTAYLSSYPMISIIMSLLFSVMFTWYVKHNSIQYSNKYLGRACCLGPDPS